MGGWRAWGEGGERGGGVEPLSLSDGPSPLAQSLSPLISTLYAREGSVSPELRRRLFTWRGKGKLKGVSSVMKGLGTASKTGNGFVD